MWDLLKEPSSHGFQVVVLTWVDAKSRLDRLKDRMDFLLERLDLDPVPVFAYMARAERRAGSGV